MQSRETAMYITLFNSILQSIENYHPNRIITDFEIGVLVAIRETFVDVDHSGCLFHMGQCLWRKIQKLPQLHRAYQDDLENMRAKMRCFQALTFVPENMLYYYFCRAAGELPNNNDILCMNLFIH